MEYDLSVHHISGNAEISAPGYWIAFVAAFPREIPAITVFSYVHEPVNTDEMKLSTPAAETDIPRLGKINILLGP